MNTDTKSSSQSSDLVVNESVGLRQKKKETKKEVVPIEKRDIKDVCAFEPSDFLYTKALGEGAFGKVRKCEFEQNKNLLNPEEDEPERGPVKDCKKLKLLKKQIEADEKYKHMAVKIQSKYNLIKNK